MNSSEQLLTWGFVLGVETHTHAHTWAFKAIQPLQIHHERPHNGCTLTSLDQRRVFLRIPWRSCHSEHIGGC